jgi:transcriptional regulator with AAA-type ATPase domain
MIYIYCMKLHQLTAEERTLCKLVAQASTVNHFAQERIDLDRKIARCGDSVDPDKAFEMEKTRVRAFVAALEKGGRADLNFYADPEREWLGFTLLFDVFHRYIPLLDRHIEEQIDAGEKNLPAPYAHELCATLEAYGFPQPDTEEYLALFFQLRRAYFFVDKRLIGSSPCMQRLRADLWNNVFTRDQVLYKKHLKNRMEDFSTLILGPTGTGKGTAAAAIGRSVYIPFDACKGAFAESFMRAFVALNLSQFSEHLIESEFFGHRKGAFTGAVEAHDGVLARCSPYGSIFLDEIGDVSIPIQIKLLHVLQERSFSPVGSHEKKRFARRVIAATNKNIAELRIQGMFRDDFYYRLCSDVISVPSLSQRIRESDRELDDLISYTSKLIIGAEDSTVTRHIRATIDKRLGPHYPWPGNVRELEQCVRRIVIKGDYEGDLKPRTADPVTELIEDIRTESVDAEALLSRYCALLYKKHKSYGTVAKRTGLDPRTAKKYIEAAEARRS